ncbi:acyltransferase [uncultured Mucilaginibacter sp.]|uniref:acyltransferase family protein n=1 Tax=uncultured Mucilaginibacter sp. TaxID=797541 RepID=UPI00263A3470|nr:acyltransferase [uncultured Mucilaginibacter sp.]
MDNLTTKIYNRKELLIAENIKENNFDILRFLLATIVIYSHCYVLCYAKVIDTEPGMIFTRNQMDLGGIAVDFFFVTSGFLIFRSFEYSSTFASYLKKRIRRICPAFFIAFILSVLFFGMLGATDRHHIIGSWTKYFLNLQYKKQTIINILTLRKPPLQNTFTLNPLPGMMNEPLWSIQYEFVCYLIVPLAAMASVFKKKWIALFLFLLSYIVFFLQLKYPEFSLGLYTSIFYRYPINFFSEILDSYILPRLFVYFFSGACFYLFRKQILRKKTLVVLAAIAIVVSCIGVPFINLTLPIAGSYLFFYITYHPNICFTNFAKNGDFSYGMYLYAWPIQQLFMYFLGRHLDPYRLFFCVFPAVYFTAFLSWHCLEKYFLKPRATHKYPEVVLTNP